MLFLSFSERNSSVVNVLFRLRFEYFLLFLPKQTLLEYAEKWKTSEDPLPLLEVYTVAIQSYVKARPYLTSECENVALVLERLAL